MENGITIYQPNQRLRRGWLGTWVQIVKNIISSRELIVVLFRRDFFSIYRKSYLGWIWIFISPVVGIISWVLMNSTGILNPGEVGIPYPAYVLLSSSIWGLFLGFFNSASSTLGAGSEFIMQVKYPHEALLIKQTLIHLANFIITFVINVVVLIIFGIVPSWGILLFPVVILPLFFLGASLGLVISVISVVASDVSNIFNILLGFVFYITPIIYSADTRSNFLDKVIQINPLTHLIGGVRDMILYGKINEPQFFILFTIITFFMFLFSLRLFYISEDRVVEKMI